jgi:glycosyltransferase involved in cell wall biosynthesis
MGYLAQAFDVRDMSDGIKWVLCEVDDSELRAYARDKVIKSFSRDIVVQKYLKLYSEILEIEM